MNQTEEQMEKYIRQVHRHLRLSRDMKERVESDLRTDIQLRLETGKDMGEIIRDLGEPKEAARYFNEEMAGEGKGQSSKLSWIFLAAAIVTFVLFMCYYRTAIHELSEGIAIIGGADGPTSVFIAGRVKRGDWFQVIPAISGFIAAFFLYANFGRRSRNYKIALILSVAGTLIFTVGIVMGFIFTPEWFDMRVFLSRKNLVLMILSLVPVITLIVTLRKRK